MKLDFLKPTGRTCKAHHCKTYWIDGKERCGGCDQVRAEREKEKTIRERCNTKILKEYNEAKYLKKEDRQKVDDYKKKQYID